MFGTALERVTLSIRARILASCGALAVMTGVVGLCGIWAFSSAAGAFKVAVTETMPAVESLLQVDRDMQRALLSERTLMFLRADSAGAKEEIKEHALAVGRLEERWRTYTATPATSEEKQLWPTFETARQEWREASREVLSLVAQDTPAARRDAIDLSMGDASAKFDKARKSLGELTRIRMADAKARAAKEETWAGRVFWIVSLTVLSAFALAVILSRMLARSISRPLGETVGLLRDMSQGEGDLTKRLAVTSSDEVGELARCFNAFMDKQHAIVAQVKGTAAHVASAARQFSAATEQLSSGAQEQASSLEETAASLEEMTGTVKQNADSARQASVLAVGSRDTAEKGREVVSSAVASMQELTRASKKIAEITSVIDEIAFQTNLLALNAAVESARAGEQGRGFAVVAAEVRNLAQRSAGAAKEIKALIEDSVQKVEDGSALVNKSGQMLEEIVTSVKHVTDIIAEIAAASQEQSTGIDQVNRAVTQMDQVVQQNAAQTEELSSTALTLSAQAGELQSLVGRFHLQESHVDVSVPVSTPAPRPAYPDGLRAGDRRVKAEPSMARAGNGGHYASHGGSRHDDGFENF
jgi:methyl-accepting chemotaxis protein